MTLTITVDNKDEGNRLIDGFCMATKFDAGAGKSKAQWVKDQLIEFLKTRAYQGEAKDTSATVYAEIKAIVVS